ncbi:sensor histidine kinase [Aestuariivirga litoralis]|uniref:sensor histidine kinase n=1 Tax=Aestuariivirga litoralis TaxID=2650924 RepID=UPI0018C70759|nr:sensor histidine kinase KdpD [Aestuariivirga litoralis]MBG1230744.1 sensor histidine kinase KdpD [Aestuariivirga litoralis]
MADKSMTRPDPDALLREAQGKGRGKLKIFLGASPGVGKTYSMLEEARARKSDGCDVVIALVETHGRKDTEARLQGIELLPRKAITYKGQKLTEMDIDGLLDRKPELAIIDELAHTNAPGSRHPKRWQDVLEVLAAGINVTTTLNIQHIESLNDVVARISGVKVRETVPDDLITRADEIELIDLPPDELIARLSAGKVYVPEQIGRALDSFFNKGNLTALRELALRTAASRVDAEMLNWMQSHAVSGPWPANERLLVCINEAPVAVDLVRAAKRMAERAKIPWVAVTVLTARHETLAGAQKQKTAVAMRLAESLGAEIATLRTAADAVGELLDFARRRNVSRIVVGRPRRHGFYRFMREPVFERLLDAAKDFEVTVIATQTLQPTTPFRLPRFGPWTWKPYAVGIGTAALATAVAWPLSYEVPIGSLVGVFLLSVLVTGARYGLAPALFATITSFLAYDFLFIQPYYSFTISSGHELEALLVFLSSAIFTGTLSARLKAQVESLRASQRRTQQLYDFARKIASVSGKDDVLWSAVAHIAHTLQCRAIILMPDGKGELSQVQGFPSIEPDMDARSLTAARWAFEKNENAGHGTATLPTGEWLFLPMVTLKAPFGVIGVAFDDPSRFDDPEIRQLLPAVEDQVAVAIERLNLANEVEAGKIRDVGEKLKDALLNSVSHDLRTPLVSIIGALTSLQTGASKLKAAARNFLVEDALHEARRLDRYVQNLLNMTRLNHKAVTPRIVVTDLREVVGQVKADLRHQLQNNPLQVSIAKEAALVMADPVLISQVLANILENAAKYSPPTEPINLSTTATSDQVTISVADHGPGVPDAEREKIFDLFYQVAGGDKKPSGTGLGLAIVKGMVDVMNGRVTAAAHSKGSGAVISLTLPRPPAGKLH